MQKKKILYLLLCIFLLFISFTSCKKIEDTKDEILTSIKIENIKTYSKDKEQNNNTFVNNGQVTLNNDNKTLLVNKIEPLDKFTFDIIIKNDSIIDINTQVSITTLDNNDLFKEMEITIDNKIYLGMNAYSSWFTLKKGIDKEKKLTVTINYPENIIKNNQAISFTIKIDNAATVSTVENTNLNTNELGIKTSTDLNLFKDAINNGHDFKDKTIKLLTNIDYENKEFDQITNKNNKLDNVTIDGNNHSIKSLKTKINDNGGIISYNTSKLTFKNIIFDNIKVETTSNKNQTYAGVIIGKNYANVTFDNVKVINSKVINNWQCGGFVGYSETYSPSFKDCKIENSFIGGSNATAGCFFGLGVVDIKLENCLAKNIKLFTDGLTWDSTQKLNNSFQVGHLYGKKLNLISCKEENVKVVDKID